METIVRRFGFLVLLGAVLAVPLALTAQTPSTLGSPANFDAYNYTGSPVYGLEIEADGITVADVTRVFGANYPLPSSPCLIRYCKGDIVPFAGGVYIRWHSPWDANLQQFTQSTPPSNGTVATGESCWTIGLGARYPAAGCEHFGISTIHSPTATVYRWLVPDPQNPGQLIPYAGPPLPIPAPFIAVVPPAQAGAAPAVAFEIHAAPPPPAPAPKFGDAQWVKVFKLELDRDVQLEELMGGNAVVPEGPQQAETEWKLLQFNPHSANSGILHNQAQLGNGSHAVVRRYEHYKYTGSYDPSSHQAMCGGDGSCNVPQAGELGEMIGAQNAAANLGIQPLAPGGVAPPSGSGFSPAMTFTFNDPRGWQDLDVVNILIGGFLDGQKACYLAYSRPANVLYLVNDPGTALLTGLTLGSEGSVANSQCAIAGAGSSAAGSGDTLTLTLAMTFQASFAGNKVVYLAARDVTHNNSGWQAWGTWGVPGGAPASPAVGGVTPARGAGSGQPLTFTFSDTRGVSDLGVVNILINDSLDGRNACYLAYSRPDNVLFLVNDAGTSLLPGLTLNGAGTVSNSQCTVSGAGSSFKVTGNTLTLTLNVSFPAGFSGNRIVYMAARDNADVGNSGWQAMGSWSVQ
jgi:hypothetical protein